MAGECQLVYFTPEAILQKRQWHRMLSSSLYQEKTVALVIDGMCIICSYVIIV